MSRHEIVRRAGLEIRQFDPVDISVYSFPIQEGCPVTPASCDHSVLRDIGRRAATRVRHIVVAHKGFSSILIRVEVDKDTMRRILRVCEVDMAWGIAGCIPISGDETNQERREGYIPQIWLWRLLVNLVETALGCTVIHMPSLKRGTIIAMISIITRML